MNNITTFFTALIDPNFPFLRNAYICIILASIPFAFTGSFIVIRRIGAIASSIAHATLGGFGIGLYIQKIYDIAWFTPSLGGFLIALFATLLIWIVEEFYPNERTEIFIQTLWPFFMAIGLIAISQVPGYVTMNNILFGGSIITMSTRASIYISILSILMICMGFWLFYPFLYLTFDRQFLRIRQLPTRLYSLLFYLMIVINIFLLTQLLGIMLVITLMLIPTSHANTISQNIRSIIMLSIGFIIISAHFGLMGSYLYNLPAGASIVFISCILYMITLYIKKLVIKKKY